MVEPPSAQKTVLESLREFVVPLLLANLASIHAQPFVSLLPLFSPGFFY